MAESYGNLRSGHDMDILPYVDAVNIACGFHGGDPLTILDTIKFAHKLGKQIGAHPSYPDLAGFGRRFMDMSSDELYATILYQIGAVKAICESIGADLNHVKPHGALYNEAYKNEKVAEIITRVVKDIDPRLEIFVQENGVLAAKASHAGLTVKYEGFADRRYNADGTLASRSMPGAVISNPKDVKNHAKLLSGGEAWTISGNTIRIKVDTICLHGDHPDVVTSLSQIRD